MKAHVSVILLLALLAAGLTGRIARYGLEPSSGARNTEALAGAFLEKHGWRLAGRTPLTSDSTYSAMVFQKPGCAAPLLVSDPGAGADAAALYRRTGKRWVFLRNGGVSDEPETSSFVIAAAMSVFTGRPTAPMLAVSPPPLDHQSCAVPEWPLWAEAAR
jgi:hypothetical protein